MSELAIHQQYYKYFSYTEQASSLSEYLSLRKINPILYAAGSGKLLMDSCVEDWTELLSIKNEIDLNISVNDKQYSCIGFSAMLFALMANYKHAMQFHLDNLPFIPIELLCPFGKKEHELTTEERIFSLMLIYDLSKVNQNTSYDSVNLHILLKDLSYLWTKEDLLLFMQLARKDWDWFCKYQTVIFESYTFLKVVRGNGDINKSIEILREFLDENGEHADGIQQMVLDAIKTREDQYLFTVYIMYRLQNPQITMSYQDTLSHTLYKSTHCSLYANPYMDMNKEKLLQLVKKNFKETQPYYTYYQHHLEKVSSTLHTSLIFDGTKQQRPHYAFKDCVLSFYYYKTLQNIIKVQDNQVLESLYKNSKIQDIRYFLQENESIMLTAFKESLDSRNNYYFKVFLFFYQKFSFLITKDDLLYIMNYFVDKKVLNERDYLYFLLTSEVTHFIYFQLSIDDKHTFIKTVLTIYNNDKENNKYLIRILQYQQIYNKEYNELSKQP